MTLAANASTGFHPVIGGSRSAGKRAKLTLPEKKKKPKQDWLADLREFAILRAQFLSLWLRRGMGMTQARSLDPALLAHGLTLVLPGIEAESIYTYGMCDGLFEGGLPGQIRVFNWGLPFPGGYLANLSRIDRNRRRAADIAAEICAYQDRFPGRPVHLVAQSGGAGVAVFAAESMPGGRMIDSIVLLGGALSRTYNLAPALRNLRKGLLNSYSHKDFLVLNWGTRVFGTMDRKFVPACGCVGFDVPAELTAEELEIYDAKLTQLPWTRELADHGHHLGGHFSSACEKYLAQHIAPWMMA